MTNDPSYSSPKSPRRDSSDINFNDVFGGPPRRASIQEFRYSFGESTDSSARRSDDETTQFRHRRSGLAEKPVFGDDGGNGRKYPSEGFFGDIFRGNEFLSSSPRKHDRDLFSLSPGSRVMSPVRPLPPKAEPFGPSSLPAQFSLYKNKDGASTATAYSCSPLSRSSSHGQGDLTRQSSVSEELSLVKEECSSNLTKLDEIDKGNSSKRHSYSCEVAANGTQFHFSFYRWASKGVPLPMPLGSRLKDKHKLKRRSGANGMIACETGEKELLTETPRDADSVSFTCSRLPVIESLRTELDKKENGALANISNWGRVEGCQTVNDVASNTKSETSITNVIEGDVTEIFITNAVIEGDVTEPSITNAVIEGDVTSDAIQESEEMRTHSILDMDLSKKTVKKSSAETRKDAQNQLKPLRSPFFYQENAKSIDVMTRKSESEEIKVRNTKKSSAVFGVNEKLKIQDGNLTALFNKNINKANQPNLQSSPANSLDNLGKNRVRGKVKEFVKIFNQEALKEIKPDANSQNQSDERKGRSKLETKHEASVRKNEMTNADNSSTPATIVVADEYLNQSENLHHETKTGNFKSTDKSAGIRNSSVSSPYAFVGDTDESFQVSFLIKELDQNVIEVPQTEEIQVVDAKIRKWSNGKEGNIRSLLSTLQYVLWSASGWKPVPLADIIEGNAVKRSYQKALLCLHPDKLQQKGATSEQKYIAEKVFDLLQEAWTHFNTLGSA